MQPHMILRNILCAPVKLYQWCLSPLLGTRCRFEPSCSHYAIEAVQRHGLRGVLLSLWRVLRCQPLARAGHDPVPAQFSFSSFSHTKE